MDTQIYTQKHIQSSKVYTLKGEFENIDVDITLYDNHHIFKKITKSKVELAICRILMAHPHKNIVKIFEVGTDYVIMENVNIDLTSICKNDILAIMTNVKQYLQYFGIIYIDWKRDNIGINKNGELVLFDFNISGLLDTSKSNSELALFNVSGLLDINYIIPGEWIIAPKQYYAYNHAISNGFTSPFAIDDYSFKEYL